MSLKAVMTSASVSLVAAGSLVPISNAAGARDWRGDRDGHGPRIEGYYDEGRDFGRWDGRRHRDHTGRKSAIAAFASIIGLALATAANRVHDHHYRDRD